MSGMRNVAMLAALVLGNVACGSPAVDAAAAVSAMPAMAVAGTDAGKDVAGAVVRLLDGQASVDTRFGTVGVLRNEDEGISYLTYNGDAGALGVEMDHVSLIAQVRWADRDAVMFQTDCSGSSCGWPSYGLLELRAGATPQLLHADDIGFMACDMHSGRDEAMSPQLSVQGDGSVLIGTAGDERAWFVYRPGQLVPR